MLSIKEFWRSKRLVGLPRGLVIAGPRRGRVLMMA